MQAYVSDVKFCSHLNIYAIAYNYYVFISVVKMFDHYFNYTKYKMLCSSIVNLCVYFCLLYFV